MKARSLKIVTWNIHRCFGTDRRYSPERVADVLVRLDADIICLQEVDSSLRVSDERDQLTYLADRLRMRANMVPTLTRDQGAYGNATLSRFDVLAVKDAPLSDRPPFEPRGALIMDLALGDGCDLRVVNTHLGLRYLERAYQIDLLLGRLVWRGIEDLEKPVLLVGDLNEWFRWTGNGMRLKRAFHQRSKHALTFPAAWPRFALDRILGSGRLLIKDANVVASGRASDHRPLAASVELF